MKTLCIVAMRSGSKGLANKNLILLNGKPLLFYTLKTAFNSNIFDEIVVSTDSDKIAAKSLKYGAKCWFRRPKYLSTDKAHKLTVIRHALLKSEKYFKKKFDIIFDLDATSPLRKKEDIINAYKKFIKENANNLITACLARRNPYFNMVEIRRGKIQKVKGSNRIIVRRQDAPKVYDMNASIYIWKRKTLLNSNNLFNKQTSLYVMPQERSVDIDSAVDLKLNSILMNKKNYD